MCMAIPAVFVGLRGSGECVSFFLKWRLYVGWALFFH